MIIPVVALLLLVSPALIGGRLSRLAGIQLQGTRPLFVTLVAQFIVLQAFSDPGPMLRPVLHCVHVASYVAAAWFLWVNRRVPWLWLVGLGAASNGITIAINGGTLPARPAALRFAHLAVDVNGYANSGALGHPRLWFLGDVFALPGDWPLANVFSIGDLTILTGVALVSIRICGSWFSTPWPVPTRFQRPLPAVRRYPEALSRFAFPASGSSNKHTLDMGPPSDLGSNWQSGPMKDGVPASDRAIQGISSPAAMDPKSDQYLPESDFSMQP